MIQRILRVAKQAKKRLERMPIDHARAVLHDLDEVAAGRDCTAEPVRSERWTNDRRGTAMRYKHTSVAREHGGYRSIYYERDRTIDVAKIARRDENPYEDGR